MPRLLTQYHRLQKSTYQNVWDFQTQLHNKLKDSKGRKSNYTYEKGAKPLNHLVFCEHMPVYTLGKSGKRDHLLISENEATDRGIEFHKVNRGGDITYHGPGQLTGYLILDLELLYRDVHKYVRTIEEAVITLLLQYGINGERLSNFTGVWVKQGSTYSKVCAIGVHLSRWVSMHGFGLNVNPDLSHFNMIVPCGINESDKKVTSISELLGKQVEVQELEARMKDICAQLFNLEYINIT